MSAAGRGAFRDFPDAARRAPAQPGPEAASPVDLGVGGGASRLNFWARLLIRGAFGADRQSPREGRAVSRGDAASHRGPHCPSRGRRVPFAGRCLSRLSSPLLVLPSAIPTHILPHPRKSMSRKADLLQK